MLSSRIPTAAIALLCLVLLFSPTQRAQADVPKVLNLQGYLTDAAGKPSTGNVSIRFRLYKDTTTTTHLWEETHTVALNNGHFSITLGTKKALTTTLFLNNTNLYVGMKVDSDPEMKPRVKVTSLPFAMVAQSLPKSTSLNISELKVNGKTIIDTTGAWKGPTQGLQGPAGPAGPAGPKGATGPSGPKGAPGSVKAFKCPTGTFLTEVTSAGVAICRTTGGSQLTYKSQTYYRLPTAANTSSSLSIHPHSDTALTLLLNDTTNKRLLTYYSNNAGAGWTSAGSVTYTALGATSFSHRFTQSASNSNIIVGWRNGNAGGITQIYNNGKSFVRRLSIANVSNGFGGVCNKTGTCSVYALYKPSSTSYNLRLYGSTNGGGGWSTGLNLTGNSISVYQHYWSGNYFFLRIRYRSGTTGSYYYRLYRSTDGRSFSLVRNSTTSFSINAINKNIIQLSGSPPMQSTNGGSSFSPGVPSIYRLPNVSGCRRAGNTAIFCSSCPTNIDPKLASGLFPCHGIPYGATTTPTRSNPSPTGNTYFWIDTYYIYVHKR